MLSSKPHLPGSTAAKPWEIKHGPWFHGGDPLHAGTFKEGVLFGAIKAHQEVLVKPLVRKEDLLQEEVSC
jgi:hypothetical protein